MTDEFGSLRISKVQIKNVIIHCCMSPIEGEMVNSIIVENPNMLIVVDVPLLRPLAADFKEYINRLKKPLERIFITHSHPDHWLGLEYFKDKPIYAYKEVIKEIEEQGDNYIAWHRSYHGDLVTDIKVVPSHEIAEDNIVIDGLTFNFMKFLDTEISVMLVIELPSIKVLLAQDLIYNHTCMFTGNKNSKGEITIDHWISALRVLQGKDYDIVIPGHGEPCDVSIFQEVVEYLETVNKEFELANNGDELKSRLIEKYPNYLAPQMLDMSNYFLYGNLK